MFRRLVLSFLFSFTLLYGAYDVRLGLYKHKRMVHVQVSKIRQAKYRKKIIISKGKHFYRVHAIYGSKKEAKRALRVYRVVFKDAFILKQQVKLARPRHKVKPKVKVKSKAKVLEKDTLKVKINILSAKHLLENKTIYLCYENGPKHLNDRVVKMVFTKDHVMYNPLKQTSVPVSLAYTFADNRLILELIGMQMVHEIYKDMSDFLAVQSKINGKNVHKLRYYFDEKKAWAFVSKSQNPALGSNPKLGVPKL